jgi:mRNA interferase RelE/StbE
LEQLDPQVKQRVLTAIGRLVSDPRSADLRKLKGRPESRLRVGDWRVILELDVDDRVVIIERILPRGRAYGR